ncbi:uncharacterized protein LOC135487655 [Lineus longissimus]|uniref:uncharacterized protein LOC135487655 n=1 Tax=Lineus longissimus TaxID=88925 RepID=UPI00315DA19B
MATTTRRAVTTTTTQYTAAQLENRGLSTTGTIIIAFSMILVVGLIAGALFVLWRKRWRKETQSQPQTDDIEVDEQPVTPDTENSIETNPKESVSYSTIFLSGSFGETDTDSVPGYTRGNFGVQEQNRGSFTGDGFENPLFAGIRLKEKESRRGSGQSKQESTPLESKEESGGTGSRCVSVEKSGGAKRLSLDVNMFRKRSSGEKRKSRESSGFENPAYEDTPEGSPGNGVLHYEDALDLGEFVGVHENDLMEIADYYIEGDLVLHVDTDGDYETMGGVEEGDLALPTDTDGYTTMGGAEDRDFVLPADTDGHYATMGGTEEGDLALPTDTSGYATMIRVEEGDLVLPTDTSGYATMGRGEEGDLVLPTDTSGYATMGRVEEGILRYLLTQMDTT